MQAINRFCAPTVSPVKAAQAFTRPLTKVGPNEQSVARIYQVIPKGLKFPPLSPANVLLDDEIPLRPGMIYGGKTIRDSGARDTKNIPAVSLPKDVENIPVRLVTNLLEEGNLRAINIDRNNQTLLREIIASGYSSGSTGQTKSQWLVETVAAYRRFKNTQFKHQAFTGSGYLFLYALGIRNRREFENFILQMFPEQKGTLLLLSQTDAMALRQPWRRKSIDKFTRDSTDELESLETDKILAATSKKQLADLPTHMQELLDGLVAQIQDPDERTDPYLLKAVAKAWEQLPLYYQEILKLFILEGKTYTEMGKEWQLSVEGARQKYKKALKRLKQILFSLRQGPAKEEMRKLIDK